MASRHAFGGFQLLFSLNQALCRKLTRIALRGAA
jgi:hypothetical protein